MNEHLVYKWHKICGACRWWRVASFSMYSLWNLFTSFGMSGLLSIFILHFCSTLGERYDDDGDDDDEKGKNTLEKTEQKTLKIVFDKHIKCLKRIFFICHFTSVRSLATHQYFLVYGKRAYDNYHHCSLFAFHTCFVHSEFSSYLFVFWYFSWVSISSYVLFFSSVLRCAHPKRFEYTSKCNLCHNIKCDCRVAEQKRCTEYKSKVESHGKRWWLQKRGCILCDGNKKAATY